MKKSNSTYHIPVMLKQCIEGLNIQPDGIYIDVTFGGGGHAREIFKKLNPKGKLIGFDQDPDAKENLWDAPNFDFVPANFAFVANHLKLLGIGKVDGILADLGVSSHQFDVDTRGFSIRSNAKLDMRMNQNGELTAADVVNSYSEEDLIHLLRSYGEVPKPRRLANEIISARSSKTIKTTEELIQIAEKCAPKHKEHKYYAQVFQAIRIEVNDELGVLKDFLSQSANILNPGGRLVVMSYHSLEDRLVKNYLKRGSFTGEIEKDFFGNVIKPFTEITRHPIVPTEEEVEVNGRARSAKLRIGERNGE